MGQKGTPGLRNRDGIWHIEKQIYGQTICASTGTRDIKEAELILAKKIEEIRHAKIFGIRPKRIFREAAAYYLETNMHLAGISNFATYLRQLDPIIGNFTLEKVHMGTLQPYIDARKKAGIKNKTINLALAMVRRILNLASRLWRDENGMTWLETPPLIQLLSIHDARKPYPISWEEQSKFFRLSIKRGGTLNPLY